MASPDIQKEIILILGTYTYTALMKYPILIILSLCLLTACQSSFTEQDLIGKWKTIDWSIVDTGEKINNKMDFDFKSDKTYTIDYGLETEKGKYWIASDYLETVEDGMSSKKVKIIKLTTDTFQFHMNRGGRIENVLLIKP